MADIPPWLGRKARNDETKSNRGTKSRNVHDNWCQRIYTVLKRLAQLLLLALKPGKLSNFERQVQISLSLSSRFEFTGVCRFDLYGLLRILYICLICLQLFMFVYIWFHFFTSVMFVYICFHFFTFVYVCLHKCLHMFAQKYH